MTIDEAVGRILRSHVLLLVTITLLPLAALLALRDPGPQYVASVRVQVGGGPAASSTEADAVSTRVAALATTRRFVVRALAEASARRPLKDFVKDQIVTTRIGQSAVVQVDVVDEVPAVAATVARSLGDQVVTFMNASDHTDTPALMKTIEDRRQHLFRQRATLTKNLVDSPQNSQVPIWQAQLSVIEQQLAETASDQSRLLIDEATRPRSVVVDDDGVARAVPSRLAQQAALALVLGLVLALTVVTALEVLRPTVPSSRALGRILEAPVLGRVRPSRKGNRSVDGTAAAVARSLRRRGLTTAVLTPVPPEQEVPAELVEQLAATHSRAVGSKPVRWRTLATLRPEEESRCGVVVLLSTSSAKLREVDLVVDLLRSTDWPVLGVVRVPRFRSRSRRDDDGDIRRPGRRLGLRVGRRRPKGAPSGPVASDNASAATSQQSLRCRTVGLHVDVASQLAWVGAMVEEALAGDVLRVDDNAPPADLRVLVERDTKPFDVTGWQVVTRGVHTDGTRVVMEDACGTGFTLLAEPDGEALTVRARWRPNLRSRLAAGLLPSRFHLLVRCALLQYPALWWAGVRGGVPLHASALRLGPPHEDVVALLAGPGGVGKSTLLARELRFGGQATADNICVVSPSPDGRVVASGLLEPLRLEGAGGRRMPHGRGEQAWRDRAGELVATRLVVVRRGRQKDPLTRATSKDDAVRVLVGGTYAAGELRRYWPFAASMALGTGLGPVHPPIPEAAREVAAHLPCTELVLPSSRDTRLSEVLPTAGARR